MKTETITTMEYSELDRLVNEYFPKSGFEFCADEEANNDNVYKFTNVVKEDIKGWNKWDFDRFCEFLIGKITTRITNQLLQFFVAVEILPEGTYLIEVSY